MGGSPPHADKEQCCEERRRKAVATRGARRCRSTRPTDGLEHAGRCTDLAIFDGEALPTGGARRAFRVAEARAHSFAADPVQALPTNALIGLGAPFAQGRTIIHATSASWRDFTAPLSAIIVRRTNGPTVVLDARTLSTVALSGTRISECADRLDARAIDAACGPRAVGVVLAGCTSILRARRRTIRHGIEETDPRFIIRRQARLPRAVNRIHRRLDSAGHVLAVRGVVGAVDFTRVG